MASLDAKANAAGSPSPNDTSSPAQANPEPDASESRGICSICGNEHDSEYHDDPIITYCGHVFGRACLDVWLASSPDKVCPRAGCGRDQFHARCGHRCQPRSVLGDYPFISPRAEERTLERDCRKCWAYLGLHHFRRQDPLHRQPMDAIHDDPDRLPTGSMFNVFADRWGQAMRDSQRRWEASAQARRDRW